MLLARRQLRIAARARCFQRRFNRNRVLLCVLHTLNPSDGIRMPLTDPLAPESIVPALRQDRIGIQTVQRKQTRVPPHRDNADVTALLCSGIYFFKVLWNARMRVKTINDMKMLYKRRTL